MPDGFEFDGKNLEHLARDLKLAAEAVRKEVEVTLLEVGVEITAAAKGIASRHSRSIPGTIRMRKIPGAVVISAGSDAVPLAALYELGNKGSKRSATHFRHPVFGNRNVWVEQEKHPYLRPAMTADRRSVTRRMEVTWDRALDPFRLKPGGGIV